MTESFREMIVRQSQALKPIPTSAEPILKKLNRVRAVLFDLYGTLLISGCGDIGTSQAMKRRDALGRAFVAALVENGVLLEDGGDEGVQLLFDEIAADQRRSHQLGVVYPEVDIVDVWRRTCVRLRESGMADSGSEPIPLDFHRIALSYELRTNPSWPMPHAQQCLTELHRMGMLLGIISNAQFLTIELWKTLLQADLTECLIDRELEFYSYQYGHAKPGLKLFELAADVLEQRGISRENVLYIGNDMLNDMMPAEKTGFRTALFAGDARSLRRREGDSRVVDVQPDLVLTDLSDLPKCVDLNCRD